MYICKCIKGSGKASPQQKEKGKQERMKENGQKKHTQFYKSAFSKQSKSDDKTDGTACALAFISFCFLLFFSYREKVLLAVSTVVVFIVFEDVSLPLPLPLFETAM